MQTRQTKTKPTLTNLRKAYESLPANSIIKKRDEIVRRCYTSVASFYRWLDIPDSVPKLARVIIADVLGKKVKEIFPEVTTDKN